MFLSLLARLHKRETAKELIATYLGWEWFVRTCYSLASWRSQLGCLHGRREAGIADGRCRALTRSAHRDEHAAQIEGSLGK